MYDENQTMIWRMRNMTKNIIKTDKAPAAIGPYSQAIEVNGIIYTSGVIPIDPATNTLVEGDITVQANQAIGNLIALLKEAGASSEDVIKTTVFIKDMNDFAKVNDVYANYFKCTRFSIWISYSKYL